MAALNENALSLLAAKDVSVSTDGDTILYTVPTGKSCILSHAILVTDGDAGNAVTMSIGANGSETDFVGNQTLSNLDAAGDAVLVMPVPNTTPVKMKRYVAGTVIDAKIASENTTGITVTVYLFGLLY